MSYSDKQFEKERSKAREMQRIVYLHILDLLRPHADTDPLMPDVCDEIAMIADENSVFDAAYEVSAMGHATAMKHLGPKHRPTRMFAKNKTDYQRTCREFSVALPDLESSRKK